MEKPESSFGQPNSCLVFHQTPNLKHRLVDLMEKKVLRNLRKPSGAGGLTGGFWGAPPLLPVVGTEQPRELGGGLLSWTEAGKAE